MQNGFVIRCAILFQVRQSGASGFARFGWLLRSQHASNRGLQTGTQKFDKEHQEVENDYSHSVVKALLASKGIPWTRMDFVTPIKYSNVGSTTITDAAGCDAELMQAMCSATSSSSYNQFIQLTSVVKDTEARLEEAQYRDLCLALIGDLPAVSDDQLCDILACLGHWRPAQSTMSPNFVELWNALDAECTTRCASWDVGRLFQVAHLWFDRLKLSRITKYNSVMIRKMGTILLQHKDDGLTPALDTAAVVQLLFFINLQREVPQQIMFALEKCLVHSVRDMSLEQLGVAALGFFKTQTRLQSMDLVRAMVSKLESELESVQDVTLASLVKVLRYGQVGCTQYVAQRCERLQERLIHRLDHLQPSTVAHLALLGVNHSVCSRPFLMALMRHYTANRASVRLKELARALLCISLFIPEDTESKQFAGDILQELRTGPTRPVEIEMHSTDFVSLLLYAAYLGCYPADLISQCLNQHFLKVAANANGMGFMREAYVLDCSVGLECPQYDGERMRPMDKIKIFKKFHAKNEENSHMAKIMLDVQHHLADVLNGWQFHHVCHILPHFKNKDILLIRDKDGNVCPIPESVRRNPSGTLLRPSLKQKWIAIFLGGRSAYLSDGIQLKGSYRMKLRQLNLLGYSVIEVPCHIYSKLYDSQKLRYLQHKIDVLRC